MRQSQPDGKVRFPHFRYSCTLGASLVLGVLCVSSAQEPAKAKKPDSGRRKILFEDTLEVYRKPARVVFADKVLPPVKKGLLILDGEYVSPPYRLSRKANYLFVNSRRLAKYAWPPNWICARSSKPTIPKHLLKNARGPQDLQITKEQLQKLGIDLDFYHPHHYIDVLTTWYDFHYLSDYAWAKLAAEMRRWPFIRNVELLPPPGHGAPVSGMRVHYKNGLTIVCGSEGSGYAPVIHIPGHRTTAKAMDAQLASLHSDLSAGNLVLWDSSFLALLESAEDVQYRGHAADRIPPAKLRSKLPKVVEIINQDTPLEKRAWALMVLRFASSRESARAFIKAFTTDPEFRRRLNALAKPRP